MGENNKGFSIVELVISSAVIMILAVVISQVFANFVATQRRTRFVQDSYIFSREVLELLSAPDICARNFGATSGAPRDVTTSHNLTSIRGPGAPIYVNGITYLNESVQLGAITLENYRSKGGPIAKGTMDLVLDLVDPRSSYELSKTIPLAVELSGNRVDSCHAISININQPWTLVRQGDLNFNGYRVGVGDFVTPPGSGNLPDPPGAKLEVRNVVQAATFYKISDVKTKTKLRPLSGLEVVRKVEGVHFYNKLLKAQAFGVIAQQVEPHYPHLVHTAGRDKRKSVSYSQFVPPLVDASKKLSQRSQNLKSMLLKQLKQIQALEQTP